MASNADERTEKRIRAKQTFRIVVFLIIAAVLALWAFANTDEVAVDWLVDTTRGPLVVVILISALFGFVLGAVAVWRQGR